MAEISKITLPSGSTYDIKDETARNLISELTSSTSYLGVTTTAITDGATTSPITIGDKSVTPKSGNIVGYGDFTHEVRIIRKGKLRKFKEAIKGFVNELKSYAINDISDETLQKLINSYKLNMCDIKEHYSENYYHRTK